jgi:Lrp/AsnC family transcriptional regulator, leucine-responsive regulatory protein
MVPIPGCGKIAKAPWRARQTRYDGCRCEGFDREGTVELDDFDRRLLDALQEDNCRTGEELGALVGLSPAACLRRVQRLRDEKVIERDVSILAPEALGRRLTMVVLVTLERESPDVVDGFKRSMRGATEVMQCYYVTGAADFVLVLTADDMADYEEFTRRYLFERNVRRFETMAVMDRVKIGTAIPMAGPRRAG